MWYDHTMMDQTFTSPPEIVIETHEDAVIESEKTRRLRRELELLQRKLDWSIKEDNRRHEARKIVEELLSRVEDDKVLLIVGQILVTE